MSCTLWSRPSFDWSAELAQRDAAQLTSLDDELFASPARGFERLSAASERALIEAALTRVVEIDRARGDHSLGSDGDNDSEAVPQWTAAEVFGVLDWKAKLSDTSTPRIAELIKMLFHSKWQGFKKLRAADRWSLGHGALTALIECHLRPTRRATPPTPPTPPPSPPSSTVLAQQAAMEASIRSALDAFGDAMKLKVRINELEVLTATLQGEKAAKDAVIRTLTQRVSELEARIPAPSRDAVAAAILSELEGPVAAAAGALCATLRGDSSQQAFGMAHPMMMGAVAGAARKFTASSSLRASAATQLFIDTLLSHGVHSLVVPGSGNVDLGKFELRFHGTSADNARQILANGFDPSTRSRNAHGPGEYFGDFMTASVYENGAMLVALIFTAAPGIVTKPRGHQILVVNNPLDGSAIYCVPLGTFESGAPRQVPQRVPSHGGGGGPISGGLLRRMQGLVGGPLPPPPPPIAAAPGTQVQYQDNGGAWTPADPAMSAAVLQAQSRGQTTVNFTFGPFPYIVDLSAMTQTNTATGTSRPIRIV